VLRAAETHRRHNARRREGRRPGIGRERDRLRPDLALFGPGSGHDARVY